MKKLAIIILSLLALSGFSQAPFAYYANSQDNLVGADTGIYTYPTANNTVTGFTLQHIIAKHSGTTATQDTGYIQKSLDGVHWYAYATLHGNTGSAAKSTTTAYMTGVASPYLRYYVLQTGSTDTMHQNVYWMLYPQKHNIGSAVPTIKLATDITCTNTTTKTYTTGLISGVYAYAVQVCSDSVSGDGTSTITVLTSNDGTTWKQLQSQAYTATGNIIYENLTGNHAQYIRVVNTHTGTGVDKFTCWLRMYPRTDFGAGPVLYTLANTTTISDNETKNYAYPSMLNGAYGYSVQVLATEVSGTATLTVLLQTSNDNTNWTTLQTTGALSATGNELWVAVTPNTGRYIRVSAVNSGSGAWTLKATIKLWNKLY